MYDVNTLYDMMFIYSFIYLFIGEYTIWVYNPSAKVVHPKPPPGSSLVRSRRGFLDDSEKKGSSYLTSVSGK